MKKNKVIIISYFYPPCNLTGGNRAKIWAETLHEKGIYPIVITRSWNHEINDFLDMSIPSKNENEHIVSENHEVFYLEHKGSLKDKFVQRFKGKFRVIRKTLSFFELLLQNIHPNLSPYKNLYKKARELVKNDDDIGTIIITGMPFHQFIIGYQIKKEFPTLHWIADYRDEWTSRPNFEKTRTNAFLNKWDEKFEKKWTSTAKHITYVDRHYLKRLREHLNHQNVHTIRNGFIPASKLERQLQKNSLTLTFPGTLYGHQDISFLAQTLEVFNNRYPEIKVQIYFIGSTINPGIEDKIKTEFSSIIDFVQITPRVSQKVLINKYLCKSHALLMFPIQNMSQIIPTKIINNIPFQIPFIFAKSDHGAIHDLIEQNNLGISSDDQEELIQYLHYLSEQGEVNTKISESVLNEYSRTRQIEKLAQLIES